MNKLTDLKNKGGEKIGIVKNYLFQGNDILSQIVLAIVIIILGVIAIYILKGLFKSVMNYADGKVWLLNGTRVAKNQLVINTSNSGRSDYKKILRSNNEMGGIEFTYSIWIFIDDFTINEGKWKHILHKGNHDTWPNRAPAIFIHPNKNTLRVYMNTFSKIDEYTDIPNIPLQKWVNIIVSLKSKNLDIYINGFLKNRHVLSSIPRQNWGNIWLTSNGGFGGYISNVRYYDYAIPFAEVDAIVAEGPSQKPCSGQQGSNPPYLAANWWQNLYGPQDSDY